MIKKAFSQSGRILLTIAITVLVFNTFMNDRSNHVMRTWRQPKEVTYDGEEHSLAVVRADRRWALLDGFSWRYDIFIGKTGNVASYGHFIAWPFDRHATGTIENALNRIKVEWTHEGVTVSDALGRRVFIPSRLFVGGR